MSKTTKRRASAPHYWRKGRQCPATSADTFHLRDKQAACPTQAACCPVQPEEGPPRDTIDRSWFIVLDPDPTGEKLADDLRRLDQRVDLRPSALAVMSLLQGLAEKPAVVLLETRVEEGPSLRFLPGLREASPCTRFLILTAYGSIAGAVQALRLGAENYLCKPLSASMILRQLGCPQKESAQALVHPSLDRAIWEYIQFVLAEEGTLAAAARRLRLQPRSLRRMLQKYPPAR